MSIGIATGMDKPAPTPVRNARTVESEPAVRALLLIPAGSGKSSYIFSRRQAEMLKVAGVSVRMFFLQSRMSPLVLLKEFFRLRNEMRAFQPHVVHAQYGSMNGFLAVLACNAPLVVTFRGSDLNPVPSCNSLRIGLGHLLSQLCTLRAKGIICVSEELRNRLWWTRERAMVIVGGVNLERFTPMPRAEARAKLGWDGDAPAVLFNAGRHPKIKRLDLAQAAVIEARKRMPEIEFIVLRGDVEPDSMPLWYNAVDCVLITSDYEGSPTVLKEAMACNLPVVSVDVGDVVERLKGVSPGRLAPRDPVALGEALAATLGDLERSNGRQAVEDLSELAEAERIREIYRTLAYTARARAFTASGAGT